MKRGRFIFILLLMSILIYLEAKGDDELHNYRCQHKNSNDYIFNCTECLWTKGCIWCQDPDPSALVPHGNPENIAKGCLKETANCSIKYESKVPGKNDLRDSAMKAAANAERGRKLSPPFIPSLHTPILLNPKNDGKVLFKLMVSLEHPVDLYALMDLSYSMEKHKTNLALVAEDIAKALKEKTNDYRLGYGSFRDKPRSPFGGDDSNWDYSFHHIQNFTKDLSQFKQTIEKSKVNGGGDSYESGMDGIMQTIVCQDLIWSSKQKNRSPRKILVYFTDTGVHSGRDGSIGGILTPADYRCHLIKCKKDNGVDPEGCIDFENTHVMSYKDQLKRDYPSFSQIKKIINENNINMIFAVTSGKIEYYKKFAEFIGQPNSVGELKSNAIEMKQLIEKQYNSITRTIKVVDNKDLNSEVQIKFKLDPSIENRRGFRCNSEANGDGFSEDSIECTETNNNDIIWIKAHLQVDKDTCKKNITGRKNIHLFQFSEDQLDLDYKCETCKCKENELRNAPECSLKGSLVCGGCKCNLGYKGRFCECEEGAPTDGRECISSNGEECSNNGNCECGKCACNEGYTGKCCQITRADVEEDDCGGRREKACSDGNGKCVIKQNLEDCKERGLGNCECPLLKRRSTFEDFGRSTFEGNLCECCTAGECQKQCFSRFTEGKENSEMCSGNGACDCEKGGAWNKDQKQGKKCKCKPGFEGTFCQRNTEDDVCELLQPCVKYRMTAIYNMNNVYWENQCKENLNRLRFGEFYDDSIVRIGCHRVENVTNQNQEDKKVDGDLSKTITIAINPSHEKRKDYCQLAMAWWQMGNGGGENEDNNKDEGTNKKWFQLNIDKFAQCTISDAEDVGCDECGVRFYHNILMDSDKIFTPIEHDDHIVTEPIILVGMHNLTENRHWQYCLNCNPFLYTVVFATSIGTVLAILVGFLVAAVAILNLNDFRMYQQYVEQKKEAELQLQDMESNHYKNSFLKTENPVNEEPQLPIL